MGNLFTQIRPAEMLHLFSWELLYSRNRASEFSDASQTVLTHSTDVRSTLLPEHFALLKGQDKTCVVPISFFI